RCLLEHKKSVANSAVFAKPNQLFLQTQAGRVVNGAELEDGDQSQPLMSRIKADSSRFHHRNREKLLPIRVHPCKSVAKFTYLLPAHTRYSRHPAWPQPKSGARGSSTLSLRR